MAHRVYLGNLSFDLSWKAIKDLFRDQGIAVKHVDLTEDETGRSKGWAIVQVHSEEDVHLAIERIHDLRVDGRPVLCREDREPKGGGIKGPPKGSGKHAPPGKQNAPERYPTPPQAPVEPWRDGGKGRYHDGLPRPTARAPAPPGGGYQRVKVSGLPLDMDWKELKDICRCEGFNVEHVNTEEVAVSGVATLKFFDPHEAVRAARQLTGVEIGGCRISSRLDSDDRRQPVRDPRPPPREMNKVPVHRGTEVRRFEERPSRHMPNPGPTKRPLSPERFPQPADDRSERRLFCENLARNVTWQKLKDFFRDDFDLAFADIVRREGDGEAYGVVEFRSRQDALEACMKYNCVTLEGKPIRLRQDRGEFKELRQQHQHVDKRARIEQDPPPSGKGAGKGKGKNLAARVHVGNLDFSVTWQMLKDHMRQAGNVKFCDVVQDETGRSRGFGLVEYHTEAEADHACDILTESRVGARNILVRKDRGGA